MARNAASRMLASRYVTSSYSQYALGDFTFWLDLSLADLT